MNCRTKIIITDYLIIFSGFPLVSNKNACVIPFLHITIILEIGNYYILKEVIIA
jgi:hypothetical protein